MALDVYGAARYARDRLAARFHSVRVRPGRLYDSIWHKEGLIFSPMKPGFAVLRLVKLEGECKAVGGMVQGMGGAASLRQGCGDVQDQRAGREPALLRHGRAGLGLA